MTECSRDVLLYLVLAGIIGLIGFGHARASPIPPPGENIPLTSEDLVQPEYVEALAKELEKESAAELKNQANDKRLSRNSQNDVDRSEFNNKAFSQQRKLVSAHLDKNFSDMVLFPSQLIDMSNHKRNFDEIDRSGFSGFNKRNFDEIDRSGFSSFNKKRNFDEIDRNGFSGFSKKRNFDEIDRSGFSGFNKRNFDEIDRTSFSGFNKKRNFDEIDRNGFSGFSKKRNFDEIDRSGFSGFNKRNFDEIDRSGFSGFNKKRNFDEIDRNGFSGFNKRNFDEIDQAGLPGFAIRSAASSSKLASQ